MADTPTPKWALELCDKILDCVEGFSIFESQYYAPDENEFGCHLIEIAPVKLEIAEAGENDGEEIFDPNFDVDLLALSNVFDKVDYFHSGIDFETNSRVFIMEATYLHRAVILNIRTVPFEDAQIAGRLWPGGEFEFFKDVDLDDED